MSGLGMLLVLVGLVLVVTTYTGSTGQVVAALFSTTEKTSAATP